MPDIAESMLTARFDRALQLAHQYHRNDVRKGTPIPYISHLLIVSGTVLEHGGGEDDAIAALLHDAVEDAPTDEERQRRMKEIPSEFAENVFKIVMGCTDTSEGERIEANSTLRAMEHVEHLRNAATSSSILLVSCADKLHNARAILSDYFAHGEALWNRFNKGREGSLAYYQALVDCLRGRVPPQLFAQLEATVAELVARSAAVSSS
jgi:(p)ppGpp synthase/HD superfamily hydrolase